MYSSSINNNQNYNNSNSYGSGNSYGSNSGYGSGNSYGSDSGYGSGNSYGSDSGYDSGNSYSSNSGYGSGSDYSPGNNYSENSYGFGGSYGSNNMYSGDNVSQTISPSYKDSFWNLKKVVVICIILCLGGLLIHNLKSPKKSLEEMTFQLNEGFFEINENIFNKTYEEINSLDNIQLSTLQKWEYSETPLECCSTMRYGDVYMLFFQDNRLVGIRQQNAVTEPEIPEKDYDMVKNKLGIQDVEWVDNNINDTIIGYGWNERNCKYALVLEYYNNTLYLNQEYTDYDYAGDFIYY